MKGTAASKFKGTMLMNQAPMAPIPQPPRPAAAPPPPAAGAPGQGPGANMGGAGPSAFKGTVVGMPAGLGVGGGGIAPTPPRAPAASRGAPYAANVVTPAGVEGASANPMGSTVADPSAFGGGASPYAPQQQGFGGPPPQQQGLGGPPPQQQGFGGPPPQQQGFGGPPPQQQGFGGPPPQQQGFGGPPPQQQGFGGPPPQQQGFGGPQGQQPVQDPAAQQASQGYAAQPFGYAQPGPMPGQGAMVPAGADGAMMPATGDGTNGPKGQLRDGKKLVIFSLVTCGFFALLWFIWTCSEISAFLKRDEPNWIKVWLLSTVTCGFYGAYWFAVKFGALVAEVQQRAGVSNPQNHGWMYIIPYYNIILATAELNKAWQTPG